MSPRSLLPSIVALVALGPGAGCGGGGGGSGVAEYVPLYGAAFLRADVRLESDPDPGRYASRSPRIVADGPSVFVVWTDPRDLASSVYLRHSSDAGVTWNAQDVRVERKPAGQFDSIAPRIAVVGEAVFVVWEDFRNGRGDVYFNRSLDGGATWLPEDRRLDTDEPGASSSVTPELATDGTHVVVVWSDERSLRADVYVNVSDDGGVTWRATDRRLDTDEPGYAASIAPEVAMSGGHVVVAWADGRVQFTDIRVNRSDDFGATWLSKDVRLDSDAEGVSPSSNPRLAAEGSTFVVVWEDGRSGYGDIRANRSLDGGAHWLAHDVRLDTDVPGYGPSLAPAVAIADGAVYAAWQDGRDGFVDVRFNRSLDRGATWGRADVRLDAGGAGLYPSQAVDVAAAGASVYVVWQDGRDGNADIRFQASVDAGLHFLPHDRRVDTDPAGDGPSLFPRVAVSGADVLVVWEDERDGAADVRFNRAR